MASCPLCKNVSLIGEQRICKNCIDWLANEAKTLGLISENDQALHNTKLSEIQNIDRIAEHHAGTIMTIMAAIIAFLAIIISQGNISDIVIYSACILGIILGVELLVKALRHQQIFTQANDKLEKRHQRPFHRFKNGFAIISYLAIVFIIFWGSLIVITYKTDFTSLSPEKNLVESYTYENLADGLENKINGGWKIQNMMEGVKDQVIVIYSKSKE